MPQIPKRLYTLEELRLNDVRPEEFLSPEDSTLNTVRTVLQVRSMSLLFNVAQLLGILFTHAWLLLPKGMLALRYQSLVTGWVQAAGLAGVTAAFFAFHLSSSQALAIVAAVMFVVVGDQVYHTSIC